MTTYSISLDDLDIALLPVRSRTNDFLKKEYYQFEIFENGKNEDPPTYTTYTCHICAIDVPAAFAEEHAASKKHRANVCIMTEVSQRMRGLISARPPPSASRPAATFCDACSAVVDKDHENTQQHKLAVREDKLLCTLSKYYGDDVDSLEDEVSDAKQDDKDANNNSHSKTVGDTEKPNTVKADQKRSDITKIGNKELNGAGVLVDEGKAIKVAEGDEEEKRDDRNRCKNVNDATKSNNIDDQGQLHKAEKKIGKKKQNGDGVAKKLSKVDVNHDKDKNNHNGQEGCRNVTNNIEKPSTSNALKNTQAESLKTGKKVKLKQPNEDAHNSNNDVKGNEINQLVKVTKKQHTDDYKKDIINVTEPVMINDNKIDQRKASNEIENGPQNEDAYSSGLNGPRRNFWAFVNTYKLCVPQNKLIAIKPAGDKIQILVDDEKLNVPYYNFHSYKKVAENIQCIVCTVAFKPEDENKHTLSGPHMNRVMLAVADGHCCRRIKNWSHCILCNEVLMTSLERKHIQLQKHSDKKLEAVLLGLKPDAPKVGVAAKATYSNVVANNSKCVHVQSQQRPPLSSVVYVEPYLQKMTLEKDSQNKNSQSNGIEYPFAACDSPGDVYCVICNCHVPNKLANRADHLNGKRHAANRL